MSCGSDTWLDWCFNTLFTLYIILLSWDNTSWLSYLSIPILIIGCIKYGERTWSLYSADSKYSGDYWLASYVSKSEELSTHSLNDIPDPRSVFKVLMVSYFSDMVFSTKHVEEYSEMYLSGDYEESLATLVATHGLTYDFFYTKAPVLFSIWGCISRVATLLVFVIVLTLHIIFSTGSKNYSRVDRIITLILLVGAIILDIKYNFTHL